MKLVDTQADDVVSDSEKDVDCKRSDGDENEYEGSQLHSDDKGGGQKTGEAAVETSDAASKEAAPKRNSKKRARTEDEVLLDKLQRVHKMLSYDYKGEPALWARK